MTKHNSLVELRWPTFATLALCALLPGCPVTDNYFIDLPGGGSAAVTAAGGMSAEPGGGSSSTASGPGAAGLAAGGPAVHPDHMGGDPLGGGGKDAGTGMPDAGTNDAGSRSDGGSPSAGSGGSSGSGGQATTGGSATGGSVSMGGSSSGGTNSSGGSSNLPQPACDDGVSKGDPCSNASAYCYKGCGPDNVGYKPLSCQAGMYQEPQDGCTFPSAHNYSCYRVPSSLPTACPAGMPRGGGACSVAACTVCFGGSSVYPLYQDSTNTQKVGYCVCSDAGVWTCGSRDGSWPCPDGVGCH